jgi:hypothetical protein
MNPERQQDLFPMPPRSALVPDRPPMRLVDDPDPRSYVPARGDLVQVPDSNGAIITEVRGDLVSVKKGDGTWASCHASQLTPYITNEPRPRVANFAGILPADLESFAPGFRIEPRACVVCGALDVDLVEIESRMVCPGCVHEISEESAR